MRIASIVAGWLLSALAATAAAGAAPRSGRIVDTAGQPVAGAMVSVSRGRPAHVVTVFSGVDGSYRAPLPDDPGAATLRVRRIGFRDLHVDALPADPVSTLQLERETDPAALAAQLPANHWFALVLGARRRRDATRGARAPVHLLPPAGQRSDAPGPRRRGLGARADDDGAHGRNRVERAARGDPDALRRRVRPGHRGARAHRAHAGRRLRAAAARRRAARAHRRVGARRHRVDAARHRRAPRRTHLLGRHDPGPALPARPAGGGRRAPGVVDSDAAICRSAARWPPTGSEAAADSNARVGPHSIQVAPDGIALDHARARQPARALRSRRRETWTIHTLASGYYPHTLRFDARGRIWYTIAASNHLGFFDPATGASRELRLPAQGFAQDLVLRALPLVSSGSAATSTSAAPPPRAATR